MPRYNKIFAGPTQETMPQVRELPAAASTLPGLIVTPTAGKFAKAVAATASAVLIAQDNYLAMKGVDDAIAADDTLIGMEILPGQLYNVRIATATNIALGAALALGAGGYVVAAAAGARVIFHAEEAYNNTSGADQLIRVRGVVGYRLAAA